MVLPVELLISKEVSIMIKQPTIDKLHDMRLSSMVDTFDSLFFEDCFSMIVDKEWNQMISENRFPNLR